VDANTGEVPTSDSDRDPTVRVRVPEPTAGPLPAQGGSAGNALGSGILEFGGGGITAAGLGLLATALLLSSLDCGQGSCVAAALILGGGLGALIGAPVGVILTGALLGRQGGVLATLLGYLMGGSAAILGIMGLSSGHGNDAAIVPMLCLPLLGAVVGYELSHASNVSGAAPAQALSRASARWTPVAGVTPRGGFVGGVAGHF
jgi:hypothetical protein